MTLAEVSVRISSDISQFVRGLRNSERELGRTANTFNSLGNSLSVAVSVPLIAAGAAAFKFATGFEAATTKIENLVGVQGQELEDLKAKFLELGPAVGKTQKELADAALFIAGAGLRGAEGLLALEVSAKASAVGLGEQTAIAKVAGAAVAAYGQENLNTAQTVDKLLAIVKEGNAEASELAPVLGTVIPIASKLGVSFDEVGANIATFTRLGVSASTAVDGLKSLLGNLLKPSEQASKELAKVGLSAQDVRDSISKNGLYATLQQLVTAFDGNDEAIARVFGDVQGLTNVLATAGAQGDVYAEVLKNIQNSAGGLDAAFKRTSETAEFKLQKALAGLNSAAVQLGSVLVPIVTDILNAVTPLVQGFSSLDAGTQKLVVSLGLAAAAAGPLFKVIGTSIQTYSLARSAVLSFAKGVEIAGGAFQNYQAITAAGANSFSALQNALKAAAAGFKALDFAAKATIIGAVAGVVLALGVAFYSLSESMGEAAKQQRLINDVQTEAAKNIAAERIEAQQLTGVLKSNTASYDEKKAALDRLNQISPEYFSGLSLEKLNVEQVTTAYDGYIANLLKAATAQAAQAKIVELEKKRLDILQRINELQGKGSVAGTVASIAFQGPALGGGVLRERADLQTALKELEDQQKSLADTFLKTAPQIVAAAKQQLSAPTGGSLGATPFQAGGGGGVDFTRSRLKAADLLPPLEDVETSVQTIVDALGRNLEQKLPQVAENITAATDPLRALGEQFDIIENKGIAFGDQFDVTSEKIKATEAAIISLLENGANPLGNDVTFLQEQLSGLNDTLDTTNLNTQKFNEQIASILESGIKDTLGNIAAELGNVFAGVGNGTNLLGAALSGIADMMIQLGKLAIAAGFAVESIKVALESFGGIGAIAAGIALIAVGTLVKSKAAKLTPKNFAQGGIVYGETFARVGEYPSASRDPEIIAPLSKLKGILGDIGGGDGELVASFRMSGADFLVMLNRAKKSNQRFKAG